MPLMIYHVVPSAQGWKLSLDDGALVMEAVTFEQAERRARFLAVRAAVRDVACEIRVHDASGAEIGRWCGECFEATELMTRLAA